MALLSGSATDSIYNRISAGCGTSYKMILFAMFTQRDKKGDEENNRKSKENACKYVRVFIFVSYWFVLVFLAVMRTMLALES